MPEHTENLSDLLRLRTADILGRVAHDLTEVWKALETVGLAPNQVDTLRSCEGMLSAQVRRLRGEAKGA